MPMLVDLYPHARERAEERGATNEEVRANPDNGFRRDLAGPYFSEILPLTPCGGANDMLESKSKPWPSRKAAVGWLSQCW
jgi:hypothetical protein